MVSKTGLAGEIPVVFLGVGFWTVGHPVDPVWLCVLSRWLWFSAVHSAGLIPEAESEGARRRASRQLPGQRRPCSKPVDDMTVAMK